MAYQELIKMTKKIVESTRGGKLQWGRTGVPNRFQVSFPTNAVTVAVIEDANGAPDYWLSLLDEEGATIEEVSDVMLLSEWPDSYSQLGELYELARRNAMGADKAVANIIKALDDDIDF